MLNCFVLPVVMNKSVSIYSQIIKSIVSAPFCSIVKILRGNTRKCTKYNELPGYKTFYDSPKKFPY